MSNALEDPRTASSWASAFVERHGQALGDGRGDDAIDERHAEAVGEARTDLAAARAIGGRDGDHGHVHASSRARSRRNPIR